MLGFEALDVSYCGRATGECVGKCSLVGRTEVGEVDGEVEAGRADGGISGRVRWRNRRTGRAAGLPHWCRGGGGKSLPCGLKDIPDRFAICTISEPRSQHVIACVVPDE